MKQQNNDGGEFKREPEGLPRWSSTMRELPLIDHEASGAAARYAALLPI